MNHTPTILLIESNIPVATRMLHALKHQGKGRTEWISSLTDGLQRLQQPGITAILLSLFLRDSEGIETFNKTQELAGHIPILVLCTARNEGIARVAVDRGAADLIHSDLDNDSLTWKDSSFTPMSSESA